MLGAHIYQRYAREYRKAAEAESREDVRKKLIEQARWCEARAAEAAPDRS